ncbi:unnamed protein product, partial [Adineta steineri]
MYYDTKQGDDELQEFYRSNQKELTEENEELDNDEEQQTKKQRKRRRNEVSILKEENEIDQLSNTRPKRAA